MIKRRSTTNAEQSPKYHGDLEIKQEGIKGKENKEGKMEK